MKSPVKENRQVFKRENLARKEFRLRVRVRRGPESRVTSSECQRPSKEPRRRYAIGVGGDHVREVSSCSVPGGEDMSLILREGAVEENVFDCLRLVATGAGTRTRLGEVETREVVAAVSVASDHPSEWSKDSRVMI
jgi:hypothetical protein